MGRRKKRKKWNKLKHMLGYADEGNEEKAKQSQALFPQTYTQIGGPKKPTNEWECEEGLVSDCSIAPDTTIYLPLRIYHALWTLAKEEDEEWFAYLIGTEEGGEVTVESLYFPPQAASAAHCEPVESHRAQEKVVGAIHSHHTMGAFFSSTDDDHRNWPAEIVIDAEGKVVAQGRVKLACGRTMYKDADVILTGPSLADLYAKELKEALEVGEKESPTVVSGYGQMTSMELAGLELSQDTIIWCNVVAGGIIRRNHGDRETDSETEQVVEESYQAWGGGIVMGRSSDMVLEHIEHCESCMEHDDWNKQYECFMDSLHDLGDMLLEQQQEAQSND